MRSVDLNDEEFDLVLALLNTHLEGASDQKKAYFERLISRVRATPAADNPVVFGYKDLNSVISQAKLMFVDMNLNRKLSGKQLEQQENTKIALANSLFMWLNGEHNLKRVVLFDFVDDTYDFESHDDLN